METCPDCGGALYADGTHAICDCDDLVRCPNCGCFERSADFERGQRDQRVCARCAAAYEDSRESPSHRAW